MSKPWTEKREEAIRERCEKATAGPWEWSETTLISRARGLKFADSKALFLGATSRWASQVINPADPIFIAHARTDLPDALDEIGRLRDENKIMREALEGFAKLYSDLAVERDKVDAHLKPFFARARIDMEPFLRRVGMVEGGVRQCQD